MMDIRIATLITCHNRREKTIACLQALFGQELDESWQLAVYVVDAGSTDGTVEAIKRLFPRVRLLCRDDSLYWCDGMRLAWIEAIKRDYDYYLWLNDDTRIYENTLHTMLDTAKEIRKIDKREGIVVGSIRDPDTDKHTYGGVKRIGSTLGFRLVAPTDKAQRCDTMNGNCVLVPRSVARVTGNLSSKFTHAIADTDYGLRVGKDGFSCWVAPGYIGECQQGVPPDWTNPEIPLHERLKNLYDPKGLPPRQWAAFTRIHVGFRWPLYVMKLWLHALFPGLWSKLGK